MNHGANQTTSAKDRIGATWSIAHDSDVALVIRDVGHTTGQSVTGDVDAVVDKLRDRLNGRRLFYFDSMGRLDEIVVEAGSGIPNWFRPGAPEDVRSLRAGAGRLMGTRFDPRWLIGRTVVAVDLNPFDNGHGKTTFDPVVHFDNGSAVIFHVEETEDGANYGVRPAYIARSKAPTPDAIEVAAPLLLTRLGFSRSRAIRWFMGWYQARINA